MARLTVKGNISYAWGGGEEENVCPHLLLPIRCVAAGTAPSCCPLPGDVVTPALLSDGSSAERRQLGWGKEESEETQCSHPD